MSEQKNITDYIPTEEGIRQDIDKLIGEFSIYRITARKGDKGEYYRADITEDGSEYIYLSGVLKGEIDNVPPEAFPVKASVRTVKSAKGMKYRTFKPEVQG